MPPSMKEVCVLVLIIVSQCSGFRIEFHQPKETEHFPSGPTSPSNPPNSSENRAPEDGSGYPPSSESKESGEQSQEHLPSGSTSPSEAETNHPPNSSENRAPEDESDYAPSGESKESSEQYQGPSCKIFQPDEAEAPILLYKNQIHYPGYHEGITVKEGDHLHFACPGGNLRLKGQEAYITVFCSNNTLYYNKNRIDAEKLLCNIHPEYTARFTGRRCESNGKEIEIGYQVTRHYFHRLIMVCFDDDQKIALYSHYNLTSKISRFQRSPRWSFYREEDFYKLNKTLTEIYSLSHQRKTINRLLGLDQYSKKCIADDGMHYLMKGQLTSKDDFISTIQQEATLNFINAAPRWEIINSGNWHDTEVSTRRVAAKKLIDLMIYTGTYGIAAMGHVRTNRMINLYLYSEGSVKAIPVPRLFWKILYEPMTEAGIVLITENNPLSSLHYEICKDVSSWVKWLTWGLPKDTGFGFSYACDINDFRMKVKHAPQLEVKKLLL